MCCLLKEIAEGTYKTKHAEAARLDYKDDTKTHRYKFVRERFRLLKGIAEGT